MDTYTESDRHRAAFMAGRCEACGHVRKERLSPHPDALGTLSYTLHPDACPTCSALKAARVILEAAPAELKDRALWFLEHAGRSHRPSIETMGEGWARGALELAGAELALERSPCWVLWETDPDGWQDDRGTHHPAWSAVLFAPPAQHDRAPRVLESLGGIDVGPDDDYAREVNARLALEAGICAPADRDLSRDLSADRDTAHASTAALAAALGHDMTCGTCGRTWNSVETPTPAARCPFEYEHEEEELEPTPEEELMRAVAARDFDEARALLAELEGEL